VTSESLDKIGWFGDYRLKNSDLEFVAHGNSWNHLHPVGRKLPNSFGFYDMHGNVAEWCSDWFGDYPTTPVVNPRGPQDGSVRITRGGCFLERPITCSSYSRRTGSPEMRAGMIGFRLCLSSHD